MSATCQSAVQAQMSALIDASLSVGKIVFDEAAAGACLDAYQVTLTACTDRAADRASRAPCGRIFQGTVPPGGDCVTTSQCAPQPGSGWSCTAGKCTARSMVITADTQPRGIAGSACKATCHSIPGGYSCAGPLNEGQAVCWVDDGLFCLGTGTCGPVVKTGLHCEIDQVCEVSTRCSPATRTCEAKAASGPCTYYDDCAASAYCDQTSKQCVPLLASGALCESNDERCAGGQCYLQHCRAWSVANASTCNGLLDD